MAVDLGLGGLGRNAVGDALTRRIFEGVNEMYHVQPITITEWREWSDWEALGTATGSQALEAGRSRGKELTASRGLLERGRSCAECEACAAAQSTSLTLPTAPVRG